MFGQGFLNNLQSEDPTTSSREEPTLRDLAAAIADSAKAVNERLDSIDRRLDQIEAAGGTGTRAAGISSDVVSLATGGDTLTLAEQQALAAEAADVARGSCVKRSSAMTGAPHHRGSSSEQEPAPVAAAADTSSDARERVRCSPQRLTPAGHD